MNKKNIFLVLMILLSLFGCAKNDNIKENKTTLKEKNLENKIKNLGNKKENKFEEIKKDKNEEKKEIEENKEKIKQKNIEVKRKILEKIKQENKVIQKKVELSDFSGALEEKLKKDLEKIIVENVRKNPNSNIGQNSISTNFENPIIEGKIKEIYENDNGEIDYRDTQYSYKVDKTDTNYLDFISIIKNQNTLIIKGKLLIELDKVVVGFSNEKSKFTDDFYKLRSFEYGNKDFSYKANVSFKNLDLGINKYEIMAYNGDSFDTMNIEIKVDDLKNLTGPVSKIKIGKYCLLDSCLEEKYGEIKEQDDKYKQIIASGETNYLFKNKSFGFEVLGTGNKQKKVYTSKFDNFYIRTYYQNIGQNGKIKQEIFNKKGYKIVKGNYYLAKNEFNFDKKIILGNYNFNLSFDINNNIGEDILFIDNKEFKSTKQIENYIKNSIENDKIIYRKYVFLVDLDKQIYISYVGNIKKPERIIYLGNDKDWLENNIDSFGKILDLELSNKILGYYGIDAEKNIIDSSGDILFEITEENIGVFKVKKFDNNGNYMLYLNKGYKIK